MMVCNSSGLLTTFGGSQEVFSACGPGSLRLPGPQAERHKPQAERHKPQAERRELLEAARNQALEELRWFLRKYHGEKVGARLIARGEEKVPTLTSPWRHKCRGYAHLYTGLFS
jgi:hypothetical protein